jgi:hypothetical protein
MFFAKCHRRLIIDCPWSSHVNKRHRTLLLAVGTVVVVGGIFSGLIYYGSLLQSGCEPTLHPMAVNETEPGSDVIEYSNLTVERQREVEQAVEGQSPEINTSDWHAKGYVRYEDTVYEMAVGQC